MMLRLLTVLGATVAQADAAIPSVTVGNVRVQALSPTLLRVECVPTLSLRRALPLALCWSCVSCLRSLLLPGPVFRPLVRGTERVVPLRRPKGPKGFEDRTTFMAVDRDSFAGTPITKKGNKLSTATYDVEVTASAGGTPSIVVTSPAGAVLYNSSAEGGSSGTPANCKGLSQQKCTQNSIVGTCFWDKDDQECESLDQTRPNLLHWPSPLERKAYALVDYPRFFVPEWDLMPAPKTVSADLKDTNGFDFTNNVDGDTYIFLLGDDIASYTASRGEFIQLAGPCPVLPDYAFGSWFTWWHPFTMEGGKSNVTYWQDNKLPLDVWALDMNWRNTSKDNLYPGSGPGHPFPEVGSQDHYYDHPNSNLFPGDGPYGSSFTEWFDWLKSQKLRTYFNDHPFPVAGRGEGGLQTSPEEVAFRWEGLTSWMERGLTYWWFDHNWGFSIPPPFVNISHTSGDWEGLDNAAWGSYLYYSTATQYDKVRASKGDTYYEKPMALTKFGLPDWRPGMDPVMHQESPAHHRYPVWWTGDGVPLQGAVESTVDSGVHDFKTYVHSDCGGDYHPSEGGDLLRWTAHCAFSTIFRYHGSDHRPWQYGDAVTDTIRSYLNARYKLAPSLIAAGQEAAKTGAPFVARCDLMWPEHAADGAKNSTQYIFLKDTLVAPIWDMSTNSTSRTVWIPP